MLLHKHYSPLQKLISSGIILYYRVEGILLLSRVIILQIVVSHRVVGLVCGIVILQSILTAVWVGWYAALTDVAKFVATYASFVEVAMSPLSLVGGTTCIGRQCWNTGSYIGFICGSLDSCIDRMVG